MLIVKKPFDRLDEENKKMHEEREEKPIAEEKMLISENYHGGEESTESLPNTSNNSSNQDSQGQKDTQSSEKNAEENTCENNRKEGDEISSESNNGEKECEMDDGEYEASIENSDDNTDDNEGDYEGDDEEDEYNENELDDESDDGDEEKYGEENGDDSDEFEEESDKQKDTYNYNTEQAFEVKDTETYTRYYQTEFYRFLEIISEERTKIFDPRSSEEYNIRKLILRPYEKRPLNHYRQSRVKDSVVLLLDNSGSMDWWAENLSILADLALSRNDVEVYIAPNGYVEEKFDKARRIPISHEAVIKNLNGRKVIYVGDFDGANTPIELSWRNDIVWICPESRYRRFKAHSWVRYGEEDFKGAFLRVYDLDEMFHAFKMLLSRQYINKMWIDLHENDKFDDD